MNQQNPIYAVGLMSGTSMDGIDAALCKITPATKEQGDKVELLAFYTEDFPDQVRAELLALSQGDVGGTRRIALMSSLLGKLYTKAVENLLGQHNFIPEQLSFIASHGQTLYHSLEKEQYLGFEVQQSLQLGEPSYLAERFACPVVSDFRVRDIAAGGLGAPLVPFVDAALYHDPKQDQVLLNIGGISNITWLPKEGQEIIAFDTGPGNMLIDQVIERGTDGALTYDKDGAIAAAGKVHAPLLRWLLSNPYYQLAPPKNAGRENFGKATVDHIVEEGKMRQLSFEDLVATLTQLTAQVNFDAVQNFCPKLPDRLIVSGGGSQNLSLMAALRSLFKTSDVVTGDVLGFDNAAKEAVAFAYLGYKTMTHETNSLPQVTGAKHPVIMGKISR